MARSFYINGESMVNIQGPSDSPVIPVQTQFGLAADAIRVTIIKHSKKLIVDAYGQDNPVDEQVFGAEAIIDINFIHFDAAILAECIRLMLPGAVTEGLLGRAGRPRGGPISGLSALGTGTHFVALNITSPVMGLPYTFPYCYLDEQPVTIPLGTEKSIVQTRFRAIAYTVDPWGGSVGSLGSTLYTRTAWNGVIQLP